ncbi:MAG TPA: hypothetical protein VGL13_17230, partial [Polyangiaceae bacterium]
LREVKPESGTGLRSWGAMAVKLATLPQVVPPPGAAPAVSTGSAAASAAHATSAKIAAAVLLPALIGGGAYWVHSARRLPVEGAPIVAPIARVVPIAPAPEGASVVEAVAGDAPVAPPSPSAQRARVRVSRLEAEASMLAQVRSELRGGNARDAQITLNQLRAAFPNGALTQERDVLAIEVLAANGDKAGAQRKASAFLAAHPTSPYNAKVKRFAEAP